jgi:hypothetical protein
VRAVYSDERDAVVFETLPPRPGDLYPRERGHVYRRQPDGRCEYVGPVDPPDELLQRPPD